MSNRSKCFVYALCLSVICIANKLKLIKIQNEYVAYFFKCYCNDIVGTIIFFLYLSFVLSYFRFKFNFKLIHIQLMALVCGIMWEYLTPLYRHDTTSDPWDILAYMLGALCFWHIFKGYSLLNNAK